MNNNTSKVWFFNIEIDKLINGFNKFANSTLTGVIKANLTAKEFSKIILLFVFYCYLVLIIMYNYVEGNIIFKRFLRDNFKEIFLYLNAKNKNEKFLKKYNSVFFIFWNIYIKIRLKFWYF